MAGAVLALLTSQLQGAGVAIFSLSVTIAAVSGGLWAGVVAALLASIALPIVESPQRVFGFEQLRDLIAAVVFLAIAVVVGLVVGNAADERDRASRREREARLLAFLSAKLLSGDVPDRVLDEFVQVLLEPLGLASCQVSVTLDGQDIEARAVRPGVPRGGPTEVIPVVVSNIPLGTLIAERPDGRRPFTRDERLLLEAATRQAAVALDRARLDARARLAQLDAETNQLRAAMFSSVTHDLRTPLASIKAGVTSLLDAIRIHVGETRDAVRVRVSDEGPGTKPEEREKVFEAFYRGRESPESAGSGLGLAIARAIVTAHGGGIRIEETTGGGTAMVVDVPLEETAL